MTTFEFQVLDWYVHDTLTQKGEDNFNAKTQNGGTGYLNRNVNKRYEPSAHFTIETYGIDSNGKSCSATITGYQPYFYIALPHQLSPTEVSLFIAKLVPEVPKVVSTINGEDVYDNDYERASIAKFKANSNDKQIQISSCILPDVMRDDLVKSECKQVDSFPFYGFQFEKMTHFLKLVFTNEKARKRAARSFETGILVLEDIFDKNVLQHPECRFSSAPLHTVMQFKLYENNVEPLLRFLHERDLNACGFISIPKKVFHSNDTTCSVYSGSCQWNDVCPVKEEKQTAPIMLCSFDIEASSSHGDFPVANKGYDKLTTELLDYVFLNLYDEKQSTLTVSLNVKTDDGKDELNEIDTILKMCFSENNSKNKISRIFTIDDQCPTDDCISEIGKEVASILNSGFFSELYEGDTVKILLPYKNDYEKDEIIAISSYEERYIKWTQQSNKAPSFTSKDKEEKLLANWVRRIQLLYIQKKQTLTHSEKKYKAELEQLNFWNWGKQPICDICNRDPCCSQMLEKCNDGTWNAVCKCGHQIENYNATSFEIASGSKQFCEKCKQNGDFNECGSNSLFFQNKTNTWIAECKKIHKTTNYEPSILEIMRYNQKYSKTTEKENKMKDLRYRNSPQYQLKKNGGTRRWWDTRNEIVSDTIGIKLEHANVGNLPTYYSNLSKPEQKKRKAAMHSKITALFNTCFPPVRGDMVIQIGSVFWKYGEKKPHKRHLLTLGDIDPIPNVEVESVETERELLVKWSQLIRNMQPSILTGYNIFGFDEKFMWERADALDCLEDFGFLSVYNTYETTDTHVRHKTSPKPINDTGFAEDPTTCRCNSNGKMKSKLMLKELNSAGLGDNCLYFMDIPGIVQVDLLKLVMRDHNLSSYKLDDVASTFINGKLLTYTITSSEIIITTDNVYGLAVGDYIKLQKTSIIGEEDVGDGSKFEIRDLYEYEKNHRIVLNTTKQIELEEGSNYKWGLAKDDVTPNDIFNAWRPGGTPAQRAEIGKYCVQDSQLVMQLLLKLQVLANNMGMSSVCSVPLQYIFTRGQGIKTFSLVVRECAKLNTVIPYVRQRSFLTKCNDTNVLKIVIDKENIKVEKERELQQFGSSSGIITDEGEKEDESNSEDQLKDGYQGAFVLEPTPGVYIDDAIAVVDYSSLYPSSIISENLCPSQHVTNPDFLGKEGGKQLIQKGYSFKDIKYDNYIYEKCGKSIKKRINSENPITTCRFIQPVKQSDGTIQNEDRGILPRILRQILDQRKQTRKRMKSISDPFQYDVLEGRQLAYKVTANSVYGSLGARTSQIYYKDIAASTTSTGRHLLLLAKDKIEEKFEGSEIIYGDTDSVFINFHPKADDGTPLKGKAALTKTIELGKEAGHHVNTFLEAPHDLEYEKTFWPFILFSKKRYVGNKYEMTDDTFKLSYMGIVLKRRDNAPIVKYMYADVIDTILNKHDISLSMQNLHSNLTKLKQGAFPLDYLIITKALRSHYATPEAVVHKVLADRMEERDPGNKPQSNDRIPFIYIDIGARQVKLQGERVEHPDFIRENKLDPDYAFYIEKQISKPISQIYALVLESLPGYKHIMDPAFFENKRTVYQNDRYKRDEDGISKKIADDRMKEVYDLIFKQYTSDATDDEITVNHSTPMSSTKQKEDPLQPKINSYFKKAICQQNLE